MQALSQLSYTPAALKCEHYIGRPCISQSPFLAFVQDFIWRPIYCLDALNVYTVFIYISMDGS